MTEDKVYFPEDAKVVFQKLENLWNVVNKEIGEKNLETNGDLRLYTLTSITAAVHRLIRGVIAQINNGSIDGVEILARTVTEGMINVKYILEDQTQMRAHAYITDDIVDRIKSLNRLIPLFEKNKAPGFIGIADAEKYKGLKKTLEKELSESYEKYGKKNLYWPKLKE